MRESRYMAGLGTVLLFIGFYCLKAVLQKQNSAGKENKHQPAPISKRSQLVLILAGGLCIAGGIVLILKACKLL
jgi:hypothetical protein